MKGYKICPAYAGMIPGDIGKISEAMNLSRVCGDDPERSYFHGGYK